MACHLITRKIHLIILLAGVILSVPSIIHASTVTTPADSLQNLLKSSTDAKQRAIIYIHLAHWTHLSNGMRPRTEKK